MKDSDTKFSFQKSNHLNSSSSFSMNSSLMQLPSINKNKNPSVTFKSVRFDVPKQHKSRNKRFKLPIIENKKNQYVNYKYYDDEIEEYIQDIKRRYYERMGRNYDGYEPKTISMVQRDFELAMQEEEDRKRREAERQQQNEDSDENSDSSDDDAEILDLDKSLDGSQKSAAQSKSEKRESKIKNAFKKVAHARNSIFALTKENVLLNRHLLEDKKETKKSKNTDKIVNGFDEPIWIPEEEISKPMDPFEKLNLKFGSRLSEDGNYAMLKTYEDMLYNEISKMPPDECVDALSRTNTLFYKSLPRKFSSNIQKITTNQRENKHFEKKLLEIKKHKIRVSKQLEKAMSLTDVIKKRKGELTTTNENSDIKSLNLAYEVWKNNWNKIF